VHELKPLSETPLTPDLQPSSAVHSLITWMMILLMRLPAPQIEMLKLQHLQRLSKQITLTPNPNSGNLTHLMVLSLANSAPLFSSANSTSDPDLFPDDTVKVNYILSYLKGSALDCFKPTLQPCTNHSDLDSRQVQYMS